MINIVDMRKPGSLLSSVLIGLTGLIAMPTLAGTANAAPFTAVPKLTSLHQVIASSGYIFYSEGVDSINLLGSPPTTGNGLIVTDTAGHYVTTVDSGDGVEGIALSPDGTTLYAALAVKSAVAAIDIATITSATAAQVLYPLGSGEVPYGVVAQSGKVWVSYNPGNGAAGLSTIGSIDPTAAPATAFQPLAGAAVFYSAPELAADPANKGIIVGAQQDISDAEGSIVNTAATPATTVASGSIGGFSQCGFIGQIAVRAGGNAYVTCGAQVFSTASSNGTLNTKAESSYPVGGDILATDASGAVATGYGSTVGVYLASGKQANKLSFGGQTVIGLAFAPDGSSLYVVTLGSNGVFSLNVVYRPSLPQSALSLNIPATSPITQSVSLSGKLAFPGGKVPPTGTTVTITRTGTSTATFTAKTKSTGTFAVADHSAGRVFGSYTYAARFAGTSAVSPAIATRSLKIVKFNPGLSAKSSSTTISYGKTVVITAHLGKTHTNRTVWIYAQQAGHSKVLVGHGPVNAQGNFSVRYKPSYNTTFSVQFSGDSQVAAASYSRRVRVAAGVWESLAGYYSKSGSYYLYTGSETLYDNITFAPAKPGACVSVEIDQYYNGAWQNIGSSNCFTIGGAGTKFQVRVGLSGLANSAGYHFRIRATLTLKSTDTANLGNNSSWKYFKVS
jgi:sugar lactone lactonase YvrE